jgi:hypothetical protein
MSVSVEKASEVSGVLWRFALVCRIARMHATW